MTVAELIARLSALPPDTRVVLHSRDEGEQSLVGLERVRLAVRADGSLFCSPSFWNAEDVCDQGGSIIEAVVLRPYQTTEEDAHA